MLIRISTKSVQVLPESVSFKTVCASGCSETPSEHSDSFSLFDCETEPFSTICQPGSPSLEMTSAHSRCPMNEPSQNNLKCALYRPGFCGALSGRVMTSSARKSCDDSEYAFQKILDSFNSPAYSMSLNAV